MRLLLSLMLLFPALAQSANLLNNASFEAGDLSGWSWGAYYRPVFRYGGGSEVPFLLTNRWASHGSNYVRVPIAGSNSVTLVSQAYRLAPSTAHTFSFDARVEGSTNSMGNFLIYAKHSVPSGGCAFFQLSPVGSTNWQRISFTFTTTNAEAAYIFQINRHSSSDVDGFYNIDALQLETGSVATAFAPRTEVEFGPNLDRTHPGHIYYVGETASNCLVSANNHATLANTTTVYQIVYDNSVTERLRTTNTIVTPPGVSQTNAILLPITSRTQGWYRCYGWTTGSNACTFESTFAMVPATNTAFSGTSRTNGMFITECYPSEWYLQACKKMGFNWSRCLSVFAWGRMVNAAPDATTRIWDTNRVDKYLSIGDLEPIGTQLGLGNGGLSQNIPAWAQDVANNTVSNVVFSNFCKEITAQYKDFVKYWEVPVNEYVYDGISGSGPGAPNTFIPAVTNLIEWGVTALKETDPTAIIIFPADYFHLAASNLLVSLGRSNFFDIWTVHNYERGITPQQKVTANHFNKPLWQGESGQNVEGGHEVIPWEASRLVASRDPLGGGPGRHRDRTIPNILVTMWESLSGGCTKYAYYDARITGGHDGYISFSVFAYDNTISPIGATLACQFNLLEGGSGLGKNVLHTNLETYAWTRGDFVTFGLFNTNAASTNPIALTAVSTSNGSVSFLDMFGNVLSTGTATHIIGREPLFAQGNSITSNALAGALSFWTTNDVTAPSVAVVTWPIFTNQTRAVIRWAGDDNASLNTRDYSTTNNMQFRYKLAPLDTDWKPWTNATWVVRTGLDATETYTTYVQARDAAGNLSEVEQQPESVSDGITNISRSIIGARRLSQ